MRKKPYTRELTEKDKRLINMLEKLTSRQKQWGKLDKFSDEEILKTYKEKGNLLDTGAVFKATGEAIRLRLKKIKEYNEMQKKEKERKTVETVIRIDKKGWQKTFKNIVNELESNNQATLFDENKKTVIIKLCEVERGEINGRRNE